MVGFIDAFTLTGTAVIILIAFGFFLGAVLAIWLLRLSRSRSGKRHQQTGNQAEQNALRLLKKLGFSLLSVQPVFSSCLEVDGATREFDVTPDFLVERNGKRYVVEVKRVTRGEASVSKAEIRRQVLEYLFVSGLPCLLIQMPHGIIEAIALPDLPQDDAERT